jgi:hypothetical protein
MQIMARDRIDLENLLFEHGVKYLTDTEEKQRGQAADILAHSPDMLITVYDMPEKLAEVLADAIETGNINRLAALLSWDIGNYLDENGGIGEWLS